MKKNDAVKIGVLAGGPSSEREISLRSGKAVYDALIAAGFDAVLLDVKADESRFMTVNDGIAILLEIEKKRKQAPSSGKGPSEN